MQKITDNVVMTSENCLTGTDRVRKFSEIIEAEVYINLQGDEPIMHCKHKKIYEGPGKSWRNFKWVCSNL